MTVRPDTLSRRALNRALLERQQLLERSPTSAIDTIEHLVGLQAQVPNSPYLALWARLARFRIDDLTALVTTRRVVRLSLMRSTIHMVSARDCLVLRPVLQPAQDRALKGSFGRRLTGIDMDRLSGAGRALVEDRPRTLADLGATLGRKWTGRDPMALAHAIRTLVPLVQIPPRGVWGDGGAAVCTSAERWLGRGLSKKPAPDRMILRYLRAFGPASVRDVQAWSGLTRLAEPLDRLRKRLRTYKDDAGVELFDLPDAPRPGEDVDAPPRFLPEFDNVWLGHKDRSRVLADTQPPRMLGGGGGLLMGSVLVDGFVAGRWRILHTRGKATLTVTLLEKAGRRDRAALEQEGARLLSFASPDVESHDIRYAGSLAAARV